MKISRGIIIAVIFILAGAGYYIFSSSKNVTPSQTASVSPSQIGEIVSRFYQKYQECLKNPPQQAMGEVSVYCQNNTGLTTPAFPKNIDAGGVAKAGADPIVCGQSLPSDLQIGNVSEKGDTGQVLINESFGAQTQQISVSLRMEENQWKIDNIVCPKP
ncbi:MAG: YbjP/YqhG family protein [Patescibacteria group bacterium]|nr:YbjP/YqhG family protein [Patescibacteria group bacterium]